MPFSHTFDGCFVRYSLFTRHSGFWFHGFPGGFPPLFLSALILPGRCGTFQVPSKVPSKDRSQELAIAWATPAPAPGFLRPFLMHSHAPTASPADDAASPDWMAVTPSGGWSTSDWDPLFVPSGPSAARDSGASSPHQGGRDIRLVVYPPWIFWKPVLPMPDVDHSEESLIDLASPLCP